MDDLNDLYYFVKVVEHGGFTQAGRALDVPKSTLSRRIAALEAKYDVRLLQRTTRHFTVTETGREFHERCLAVLVEADAAREVIERRHAEPRGVVRVSCPTALLEYRVSELVARFMAIHPQVQVHLEATNRRVDLLSEGFDLALRVRFPPLEDSDLVMRVLADSPQRLVAAPHWLDGRAPLSDPAGLAGAPSLDWGPARHHVWQLVGPNGEHAQLRHHPRFVTDDMHALRDAAVHGVGIVQLPCMVVEDDLRDGTLVDVLPGWAPKGGVVHAVFPSRRGLLPRVRLLIDFLAEHIRKD
ncbi:TPA: LysR family transcriptional regulator [Burkholderia cepacia ATCC 25416]|uniref:LysR substrate-binding domain-containing protein n=1 Tax=Burkholderia cepacia TaxID=292 RepID=UPI001CF49EA6|nr:LysR substrate-binding domain-containing protein [Burkholderia cepacia]HDR9771523.1 LysR family transcriptional regulator [Burkholderia cepacia ATCC 25416]MCA8074823.1 LysR family transcriptional regulator [Burkholderia cepacia]HDR9779210.1 LysR family transcriptional regulator [Burkholderia cepacia ATCC 25416]HDR9786501.1 LysR family transcriptional regulator [Burkholderia cepacia ATCC 25416]HDR9795685.1 LysR family transcriptional regulator [Burkholderia cepacia ATCC 25416]